MTKEEAIYCMTTYLPNSDHRIYDCPKCKYYKSGCKSNEAHKLAIKALRQSINTRTVKRRNRNNE